MIKINYLFLVSLIYLFPINISCAQSKGAATLPSLEGKNILMVYGGWQGHQPDIFTERVSKWLISEGANVTISDSVGVYTQENIMNNTDLIIQYYTQGKITKEQFEGLDNALRNGIGLAGCHGGLADSFHESQDYEYIIGGQWVSHPGGIIPSYDVQIHTSNDPITEGLQDFVMKDTEQYYMHIDPNNKVLATTSFTKDQHDWIEGAVIPLSWKRYHDKGRVFYLSIGHAPKDFDTYEAWELLTRGIKWASDSKYQPKENLVTPIYSKN
ncbi:ThuA domain-containing protein [Yeosuana sp. MJ-SS3]|uniref:ThuA domain-containing protein n=1 Tax=Gilvirhabdus luticola TaxID=3079858 RepID=A0ABU3U2B5_9FLAO|nr:ThuA domain-containing protein [Yeosuana sp. MJ-SS3]MDU8884523.1 ThuA domain-containing protein [Yeosuana sp. MJ-SS3]